jgi:hypothetical protein
MTELRFRGCRENFSLLVIEEEGSATRWHSITSTWVTDGCGLRKRLTNKEVAEEAEEYREGEAGGRQLEKDEVGRVLAIRLRQPKKNHKPDKIAQARWITWSHVSVPLGTSRFDALYRVAIFVKEE